MKKLALILIAAVVVGVTIVSQGNASAARNDQNDLACEVYGRSYTVGADTVTANFEVKKINPNVANCTKEVTVAAWDAPNGVNGVPFNEQKLVDHKSEVFTPGVYSVTVKKPKCFYQIDLLRGLNPNMLGGTAGNPNYADWQFVSSAHGGAACVPPTPTPTPTPVQPAAIGGPREVGKSLPNTGPADILGISAASGVAAGIVHNVRRRISRKK